MIQIRDVSVTYSSASMGEMHALSEVSLSVGKGEFFTLIGPSGCGKTTLLNLMAGLAQPSRGQVIVGGQPITGPRPDLTSVVFQDYSLFPWRTVKSNVEAGLEFRGVKKSERAERASRYLEMVGLSEFANAYPRQLSGGMKQRVAIARSLCLESPVLLLDEPFGALDEQTRMVLGEEVSHILAQTEKSIVLVTHSLSEAVFLSDRIAVLSSRPGRVREVIEVPGAHPRTPEFMTTPIFHELRDHLFHLMHEDMRRSVLGGRGKGAGR